MIFFLLFYNTLQCENLTPPLHPHSLLLQQMQKVQIRERVPPLTSLFPESQHHSLSGRLNTTDSVLSCVYRAVSELYLYPQWKSPRL